MSPNSPAGQEMRAIPRHLLLLCAAFAVHTQDPTGISAAPEQTGAWGMSSSVSADVNRLPRGMDMG